jgi:hypothetical protein
MKELNEDAEAICAAVDKRIDERLLDGTLKVSPFPPGIEEALGLAQRLDEEDARVRAKARHSPAVVTSINEWAKRIRHELGAPTVNVEITDEQLESAILSGLQWAADEDRCKHDARRYASAMAKQMVGRARSKFGAVPGPTGAMVMDGQQLIQDATSEFSHLGCGPFG